MRKRESGFCPATAFPPVTAADPEVVTRERESQLQLGLVSLEPIERASQVVVLGLELVQLVHGERCERSRGRTRLRPIEVVEGVTALQRLSSLVGLQLLPCVLTDRREHEEPPVGGLAEQALVDERAEAVDIGTGDRLRGLEVEAAHEHCEIDEESPCGLD